MLRVTSPTVLGEPRRRDPTQPRYRPYTGDEALSKRGILTLRYPIVGGRVINWRDIDTLLHDTFYDSLRIAPEDHAMLVATAPLTPKPDRERITQILFESHNAPGVYLANSAALALLASGRTTGLVIESGEEVTRAVPVFEGDALDHATLRLELGGRHLTEYMMKILSERGHSFVTMTEREIVRDMKERLAFVALESVEEQLLYGRDQSVTSPQSYELPDGQVLPVGDASFRCTEPLFQPSLIGRSSLIGIHEVAHAAIMRCDPDLHASLYDCIRLAGGSMRLPGLSARFQREMTHLAPPAYLSRVARAGAIPPTVSLATWIGGSILASMHTFTRSERCITRCEYSECGPTIIHRKCF